MARKASKTQNEKLAQKKVIKTSGVFGKVLYFVGRPFYYILSHLLLATAFILYITGYATKVLFTLLLKSITRLIRVIAKFLLTPPKRLKTAKKPKTIRPSITDRYTSIIQIKLLHIKLHLSQVCYPHLPRLPQVKIRTRYLFLLATVIIFITPFLFLFYIVKDIPSPLKLTDRNIEVSTKIYDRNGVLLYNIYKDKNRTIIPLEKIPLHVRLATLAAEDAEFYSHPGFSIRGIARSIIRNVSKGEVSGGSTITQQLVKNVLLSPEKTVIRKVREVILALLVETKYTKDQILEMYMNEVGYGGTAYGIEEASQTYFGKSVNKLTLAEAALLAGLPKSPTTFSPFGPNPDLAIQRQQEVLRLMQINGFISQDQEVSAQKERLTLSANKTDIKAPHFVMYVRQMLENAYGKETVEKGGLEVITTLDWEVQKLAEEVVSSEINKLKSLNVGNGAAIVLNPQTGEILAMVGSKDYFDIAHDGNVNVTISPRQPGSSIKVVNYSYALTNGYTPATIISDSPVSFLVKGQEPYIPKNYDNNYRGNLTLRSAFAESRNIPAVKVLASYGVDKMIDLGTKMGITTWGDRSRFGLSLTLGGGEVKLIDLAQVYATIANYGTRPQIKSLIEIKDYKGKSLFSMKQNCTNLTQNTSDIAVAQANNSDCGGQKVVDPRVTFIITDILKDNNARAPSFGSSSYLLIPNHPEVAVKTGTSNNLRDNLTIGYNQKYLVAIWVGNNNNAPMARIASGVTGASPIWNKIISALLNGEVSTPWEIPAGVTQTAFCPLTGTLPCSGCPTRLEWFLDENKPKFACNSDHIQKLLEGKLEGQLVEPAASTENIKYQTRSVN